MDYGWTAKLCGLNEEQVLFGGVLEGHATGHGRRDVLFAAFQTLVDLHGAAECVGVEENLTDEIVSDHPAIPHLQQCHDQFIHSLINEFK